MPSPSPWSIKGIPPEARAAAKAAAQREGLTLGAWLVRKIQEEAAEAEGGGAFGGGQTDIPAQQPHQAAPQAVPAIDPGMAALQAVALLLRDGRGLGLGGAEDGGATAALNARMDALSEVATSLSNTVTDSLKLVEDCVQRTEASEKEAKAAAQAAETARREAAVALKASAAVAEKAVAALGGVDAPGEDLKAEIEAAMDVRLRRIEDRLKRFETEDARRLDALGALDEALARAEAMMERLSEPTENDSQDLRNDETSARLESAVDVFERASGAEEHALASTARRDELPPKDGDVLEIGQTAAPMRVAALEAPELRAMIRRRLGDGDQSGGTPVPVLEPAVETQSGLEDGAAPSEASTVATAQTPEAPAVSGEPNAAAVSPESFGEQPTDGEPSITASWNTSWDDVWDEADPAMLERAWSAGRDVLDAPGATLRAERPAEFGPLAIQADHRVGESQTVNERPQNDMAERFATVEDPMEPAQADPTAANDRRYDFNLPDWLRRRGQEASLLRSEPGFGGEASPAPSAEPDRDPDLIAYKDALPHKDAAAPVARSIEEALDEDADMSVDPDAGDRSPAIDSRQSEAPAEQSDDDWSARWRARWEAEDEAEDAAEDETEDAAKDETEDENEGEAARESMRRMTLDASLGGEIRDPAEDPPARAQPKAEAPDAFDAVSFDSDAEQDVFELAEDYGYAEDEDQEPHDERPLAPERVQGGLEEAIERVRQERQRFQTTRREDAALHSDDPLREPRLSLGAADRSTAPWTEEPSFRGADRPHRPASADDRATGGRATSPRSTGGRARGSSRAIDDWPLEAAEMGFEEAREYAIRDESGAVRYGVAFSLALMALTAGAAMAALYQLGA